MYTKNIIASQWFTAILDIILLFFFGIPNFDNLDFRQSTFEIRSRRSLSTVAISPFNKRFVHKLAPVALN